MQYFNCFFFTKKISGVMCLIGAMFFLSNANASQVMNPNIISIKNNEQINITLSNIDVNRIFVKGEKITTINKSQGLLSGNNDSSGSIYVNVHGQSPFTAFVSTDHGLHFSLLIMPKSIPGQTFEFKAPHVSKSVSQNTVIIQHNPQAKSFEQSEPYEKTLVKLIKDVMLQKTPPGYTQISPKAFSQIQIFTVKSDVIKNSGLTQSVKAGFLGGQLAVRVLCVRNTTSNPIELSANEFYSPVVRAVAISQEYLISNGKSYVFEVVSNV